MELGEFSDLVSTALHFDFDASLPFTPPSFPVTTSTPESRSSTGMKPKVINRIKSLRSLLIRPSATNLPSNKLSESPPLPLPPPSDPVFTPFVPLVIAQYEADLRRREAGLLDESDDTCPSDSSCSSSSASSSSYAAEHSACSSPSTSPAKSTNSILDRRASASVLTPSLDDPPSSSLCEFNDADADPFAKGRIQVVRSSTCTSNSSSIAYSMNNHPYASPTSSSFSSSTSVPSSSPKGKKSKRAVLPPSLPEPNRPLPLPPLPPLLPMPQRPLPAPPSPSVTEPHDWTLDLPLSDGDDDEEKKKRAALKAGMTLVRRRRVSQAYVKPSKRVRRISQSMGSPAHPPHAQPRLNPSVQAALRPGHRRKGSPFPLSLEIPPLPTTSIRVNPESSSPQRKRENASRSPLAHRLTLDKSTGLPIPKQQQSQVQLPAPSASLATPCTPPVDGRNNVPGWFDDEDDDDQLDDVLRKRSGDTVYFTAHE
ncbi:hypothetical protein Moror_15474 [Moniliophthora roreri MCA 2997]|uniref:Uncharacterized protein n=1 Tax=Moniliophthora roreri (strain MCA 2997) TaxID=1381753 RepID=V2XS80_MONRO|nr:hypothetical protein Moror_15474 [Moniliophthora roreri MCA 2997]